jgi:hypothetical protein
MRFVIFIFRVRGEVIIFRHNGESRAINLVMCDQTCMLCCGRKRIVVS